MELLNREEELAALDELLEAARAGRGGALVLRGEAGVGLSALLESAIRAAPPMRVARICGVRAERDLDFAAAHQLCGSMFDLLETLPEPQRETLGKAAQEQPLLCAIDDAQWLDVASAEALAFVARRLDRQGIALVIAVHEPVPGRAPFAGVDEREVRALAPDAASKLLGSVVSGPLEAVERYVPPSSTVVFGIFDGDALWATLVLGFDADLRADIVTTVDTSRLTVAHGRGPIAEEVVAWVSGHYRTCSLALFTSREGARAFLDAGDKLAVLREPGEQGDLIAEPVPSGVAFPPSAATR